MRRSSCSLRELERSEEQKSALVIASRALAVRLAHDDLLLVVEERASLVIHGLLGAPRLGLTLLLEGSDDLVDSLRLAAEERLEGLGDQAVDHFDVLGPCPQTMTE